MNQLPALLFRTVLGALSLLLYFAAPAAAQHGSSEPDTTQPDTGIPQKDIFDVIYAVLKKERKDGGHKESQFSVIPGLSWAPQTGWSASLATVMAFRSPSAPRGQKTSNILAGISYTQYNQIILPVHVIHWTRNNRMNLVLNARYMRFPNKTYGLGPHTKASDVYTINFNYLKLHPTVLFRLRSNLYGGPIYFYDRFTRVTEVDPKPGVVTDFQKYGLQPSVTASGVGVRVLYDSRRSLIKPVNGWFASATVRINPTGLGSTNSWQSVVLEGRHYIPFPRKSRNILALWSYNWLTVGGGRPPYLLLPSNAWDDWHNTGRGYVQGRYRGRNLLFFESEYRMEFSRSGLLGGTVFANAQAYPENPLEGLGRVLPAVGAGIRIKLNKYSGTNIALDYGFGVNGSQAISMNLGEVF
ncbi:hypothetical protein [Flaviaesturariibacter amylovorans]|uniref:Bacterial surface antigen (D15) domain-containing protein n=1 Tax=Flaviaesturariibacter amylovorans TaxID=1084520 RepID=A0ABP8H2C1_9BACT